MSVWDDKWDFHGNEVGSDVMWQVHSFIVYVALSGGEVHWRGGRLPSERRKKIITSVTMDGVAESLSNHFFYITVLNIRKYLGLHIVASELKDPIWGDDIWANQHNYNNILNQLKYI